MHLLQVATRRSAWQRAIVLLSFVAMPMFAGAQEGPAWRIVQPAQASIVLARDGSLIGEIGREARMSVSLRSLPKYVGQAFVAIEDHRFYQHDGVDVVGIAGALKDNIMGDRRGASTITQQLVGNMHPLTIDRSDKGLGRKIREQNAAREMERRYSKEQILEAYLNQISFGHGRLGIESAARYYFGKPSSRLTIAEAATLAAVINGPAVYDPKRNPDRVRERRNLVLGLMAEQGYITRAQLDVAQGAALRVAPNNGMSADADYFVDVVRVQASRTNVPVGSGGYRVFTSLDPTLQNAAVESLRDVTAEVESRVEYRHPRRSDGARGNEYLQGAVVVIEPLTGDVRALVGGRDHGESQFDRAVDGMRQPGSAFKPVVYAAAVSDSMSPQTMVSDTAISVTLNNGSVYRPANSDNQFMGALTLRDALAKSRNVVAVQLALGVGLDSVIAVARRMGIRSAIPPYPSSAIGAAAVQPLDLIAAYTTFANLGTPTEPRFIHRIEDRNGKVVWTAPIRALPPAIDPRVAFVVRDMMRDVVERGTATSIRRYLPVSIPVAGKTGTTNDNTDVWFIGLTPDLVGGVWLGFDRPKTITAGAAGGSLAAPIWGRTMAKYYGTAAMRSSAQLASSRWNPPVGVISGEFDRLTRLPATEATPADRRYTEYFVEGTEPAELRLDMWKVLQWGAIGF